MKVRLVFQSLWQASSNDIDALVSILIGASAYAFGSVQVGADSLAGRKAL